MSTVGRRSNEHPADCRSSLHKQDDGIYESSSHDASTSSGRSSVAFSDTDSVIELPRKTAQELCDSWYSEEEYRSYKRDCARTLVLMNKRAVMDENDCCERGLENMSKAGRILRRSRYDYSVKVVMEQQAMQRASSTFDDELFRTAYEKAVKRSVELAASRGQQDALLV